MKTLHIRRNDTVFVRSGRDKGKTGKVLKVFPEAKRVLVEGVNLVKRHLRRTKEDQPSGIVQKEATISISNLMLYCSRCRKPSRISVSILKDGNKNRICKRCKEVIG